MGGFPRRHAAARARRETLAWESPGGAIEEALERRAEREAGRTRVRIEEGTVTLEGKVRTWPKKQVILGSVSHAPGVREVRDKFAVNPWA